MFGWKHIYCCLSFSISVYRNLKYNTTNINYYNIEKDTEACAIQCDSTYSKLCILTIYRSPWGNFTNFRNRLGLILQNLLITYIIYGDGNVNCLIGNNIKNQLDAVLHSSNVACIVKFPNQIVLHSHTAIGNVFIDASNFAIYDWYHLKMDCQIMTPSC